MGLLCYFLDPPAGIHESDEAVYDQVPFVVEVLSQFPTRLEVYRLVFVVPRDELLLDIGPLDDQEGILVPSSVGPPKQF